MEPIGRQVRRAINPMEKKMFEVMTDEEIDCVSGGMGNGGGGPMKVSQLDKGSTPGSCTDGIVSGMVGALFFSLAAANPIAFTGTVIGSLMTGAVGGGCFRRQPPTTVAH